MLNIAALALILLLLITHDARAELLRMSYAGAINNMFIGDCTTPEQSDCNFDIINVNSSDFFEGNLISIDDTFSGSFIIDSNSDFVLAGDDLRQAIFRNLLSDFSLQLAGLNIPRNELPPVSNSFGNSVSIVDDRMSVGRTIDLFQSSQQFSSDKWFAGTNVTLIDNSASVYDSFSIPNTVEFTDYDAGLFGFFFLERASRDQLQIRGDITTLSYERIMQVNSPAMIYLILFITTILICLKRGREDV
uniref:hypothetical protein n=1 Tax=Ningiella ruwaisensis TaxID=2364274 RepID=UPI00109F2D46|nr:hypothetical protein [Ningiella ruwaisensis]